MIWLYTTFKHSLSSFRVTGWSKDDIEHTIIPTTTVNGLIFVGYQSSCFSWKAQFTNSSTYEIGSFCMSYEGNIMATNFESHECIIFLQSAKIGSHENKAIHSNIWNPLFLISTMRPGFYLGCSGTIVDMSKIPMVTHFYLFSSGPIPYLISIAVHNIFSLQHLSCMTELI